MENYFIKDYGYPFPDTCKCMSQNCKAKCGRKRTGGELLETYADFEPHCSSFTKDEK